MKTIFNLLTTIVYFNGKDKTDLFSYFRGLNYRNHKIINLKNIYNEPNIFLWNDYRIIR